MLARSTLAILVTLGGSVVAIIDTTPGHAQVQGECLVTSTFSGRWTRAELNCGEPEGARPRVAVVGADDLRTCPLLVGDRVSVTFLYDDPTRQPTVNSVTARGDGGPSSGDWCGRGFPPGRYAGPCLIEEDPPRQLRSDTLGAQWTRRSVGTSLRDTDGNRNGISPSACPPLDLQPGVHRIYIDESIRRGIMRPSPTWAMDRAVFASETTETNIYEGGIYIDGGLPPGDSIIDLSELVRGWGITPTDAVAEAPGWGVAPSDTVEEAPPGEAEVIPWTFRSDDWRLAILEDDWKDLTGRACGCRPAGYFIDSHGVVHLRGTVSPRPGTLGDRQTIFVLPTGYRPTGTERYVVAIKMSGRRRPEDIGWVVLWGSGEVHLWVRNIKNVYEVSLSGITFRTR